LPCLLKMLTKRRIHRALASPKGDRMFRSS
jgi:hypothetical protein